MIVLFIQVIQLENHGDFVSTTAKEKQKKLCNLRTAKMPANSVVYKFLSMLFTFGIPFSFIKKA